ncbi:MAG: FeoA family protein [Desulfobacterales bacterium]
MRLSELQEGESATIVHVGGDRRLRRRVLEMGLVKGTRIRIEKYAPLKDPLELVAKGVHLSLRVEEAERIEVEKAD